MIDANCLRMKDNLNIYAREIHRQNERWWPANKVLRNQGEAIALMHSELSEALEAVRTCAIDSHLPHRPGVEVEMADTIIRILDFCAALELDIGGALVEKLAYNAQRHDHTPAGRAASGGKKF